MAVLGTGEAVKRYGIGALFPWMRFLASTMMGTMSVMITVFPNTARGKNPSQMPSQGTKGMQRVMMMSAYASAPPKKFLMAAHKRTAHVIMDMRKYINATLGSVRQICPYIQMIAGSAMISAGRQIL